MIQDKEEQYKSELGKTKKGGDRTQEISIDPKVISRRCSKV